MALKDYYLNLITSEHRDKPKYTSTLSALFSPSDDIFTLSSIFDDSFDIDKAVGSQLDIIGVMVGQSRKVSFTSSGVLDDEGYRLLLKTKIVKNYWKGDLAELRVLWNNLFPSNNILIHDNQDMTLQVALSGDFRELDRQLILGGYVVPKPQSVSINFIHFGDTINPTYYNTMYIGAMKSYQSRVSLLIAHPGDTKSSLYIGGMIHRMGKQTLNVSLPTKASHNLFLGAVQIRKGKIVLKQRGI